MAIGILNCSILAMGNQLGTLIDTHSPPGIHGLFLGLIMTTAALCVFTLHIPTAVGIGDDMMFFSCHCFLSLDFCQAHATMSMYKFDCPSAYIECLSCCRDLSTLFCRLMGITAFHNIRLYFRDAGAVAATPAFPIKRSHAQAQSAKAASGLFSSSFLLPAFADEG